MGSIDGSKSELSDRPCVYGMTVKTTAFCNKCQRCTEEGFMAFLERETYTFQVSFENTIRLRGLRQAEQIANYKGSF